MRSGSAADAMINRLERDQVSNQPIKTLYELRHLNMGNRSMRTPLSAASTRSIRERALRHRGIQLELAGGCPESLRLFASDRISASASKTRLWHPTNVPLALIVGEPDTVGRFSMADKSYMFKSQFSCQIEYLRSASEFSRRTRTAELKITPRIRSERCVW
jgi:hypothetical protein